MNRIDFEKTEPYFIDGNFKWYVDRHFQEYLNHSQANNLPSIKGMGCFVVKGDNVEDYVLIDNKQNIISAYPHTTEGYGQMEAKINIIKINQHFEEYEKVNI